VCVFAFATIVPCFAQSNTARISNADRVWDSSPDGHTSYGVARIYTVDTTTVETVELPANVLASDVLRRTLQSMLERSPTFRRQMQRIANATGLTLRMGDFLTTGPERVGARTRFSRSDGRLHATVELRPLLDPVRLVAHEIEHVIEQLDGVNLRLRARLPNTGVRRCEDDAYETGRAVRAGLTVEREFNHADGVLAGR